MTTPKNSGFRIDIDEELCPHELWVEIVNLGTELVRTPGQPLRAAIAAAYWRLTGARENISRNSVITVKSYDNESSEPSIKITVDPA